MLNAIRIAGDFDAGKSIHECNSADFLNVFSSIKSFHKFHKSVSNYYILHHYYIKSTEVSQDSGDIVPANTTLALQYLLVLFLLSTVTLFV